MAQERTEAHLPPGAGAAARLDVIDCHVHVIPWDVMSAGAKALLEKGRGAEGLSRLREISHEPALLVERMDAAGVSRAGIVVYVSPDVMGYPREINEWVAGYVAAAPDRLFGYGSVHPRFTDDPAADMDHVLGDLKLAAIKIHPAHQLHAPNAYLEGLGGLRTVYEKAAEHGTPVAIHTGTSTFPKARNRFADPLLVEDVAIDFPELTLLLCHGGRPFWTEQAFFLVRRFPNVYMDISGIPPQHLLTRYFPRLERVAEKTLFGSDWAGPGVPYFGDLAEECRRLPIAREKLAAILAGNARDVFHLGGGSTGDAGGPGPKGVRGNVSGGSAPGALHRPGRLARQGVPSGPLVGRVAIVTGASAGIGEATARRLARAGAAVVLAARRADRLEALRWEIESAGGQALAVPTDVTSGPDRERLVRETLDAFGRIDALVNNAGYGQRGPVELVPVEDVRRNFETNLFSLIALTQLAIPVLRAQGGGRIVNVSSVAGRVAWPFSAVYGATKHALEAISDGLRGELAPFGIQVVVIQPGFVATEFAQVAEDVSDPVLVRAGPYGQRLEAAIRRGFRRMKRLAAPPEQIAELVLVALTAERPRPRYAAPLHAKGALLARRLLPDRLLDWILTRNVD